MTRTQYETVTNQHGCEFTRVVSPKRRFKTASGLRGRQWVKFRKALRRAERAAQKARP